MTSTAELTLTEADFQRQITELAELRGWEWMHPRAGRTKDSWRTPMSGTMAQGWPDLVLVHRRKRRLLFIEVKKAGEKPTPAQERVLNELRGLAGLWADPLGVLPATQIGVYVWQPKDWPFIEKELTS